MNISFEIAVGDCFPENVKAPAENDLLSILQEYGIENIRHVRLIDSTHGEQDIRLNYIVDLKYVLRFCNAPDMTEARLQGLNRLVGRYRALDIQCPLFISHPDGLYLHSRNGLQYYLSEYLDLPLAKDADISDEARLDREVTESVARFAETYRNVDLLDTAGMYSLFDLSPFDKEQGIDEKEQNFNALIDCLNRLQREDVAAKLRQRHQAVRERLRAIYRSLPRCVFQGDENYSNVLIDSQQHFRGFIDFNLAGTEVIVNQLANLAGFDYDEANLLPVGERQRLDFALRYYRTQMAPVKGIYRMSPAEEEAIRLYAWIVMVAQWPTLNFFRKYLNEPALADEIAGLLCLIAALPEEELSFDHP